MYIRMLEEAFTTLNMEMHWSDPKLGQPNQKGVQGCQDVEEPQGEEVLGLFSTVELILDSQGLIEACKLSVIKIWLVSEMTASPCIFVWNQVTKLNLARLASFGWG